MELWLTVVRSLEDVVKQTKQIRRGVVAKHISLRWAYRTILKSSLGTMLYCVDVNCLLFEPLPKSVQSHQSGRFRIWYLVSAKGVVAQGIHFLPSSLLAFVGSRDRRDTQTVFFHAHRSDSSLCVGLE